MNIKLSRTKSLKAKNMHILSQITVFKILFYQKLSCLLISIYCLNLKQFNAPAFIVFESEKGLHQNPALSVNTRNRYETKKKLSKRKVPRRQRLKFLHLRLLCLLLRQSDVPASSSRTWTWILVLRGSGDSLGLTVRLGMHLFATCIPSFWGSDVASNSCLGSAWTWCFLMQRILWP